MAGTPLEIPLTPSAQKFQIALGLLTYTLTLKWVDQPNGGWTLDIGDSDENPIVGGIPLITGADLLEQYKYVGIPGQLIVQTDHDINAVPTYENLGINSHLYFIPNE